MQPDGRSEVQSEGNQRGNQRGPTEGASTGATTHHPSVPLTGHPHDIPHTELEAGRRSRMPNLTLRAVLLAPGRPVADAATVSMEGGRSLGRSLGRSSRKSSGRSSGRSSGKSSGGSSRRSSRRSSGTQVFREVQKEIRDVIREAISGTQRSSQEFNRTQSAYRFSKPSMHSRTMPFCSLPSERSS